MSLPARYVSATAGAEGIAANGTLIRPCGLDITVFPEQTELLDKKLAAAGVPYAVVPLPWAGLEFEFVNFTPGRRSKVFHRASSVSGIRYHA